MLTERDLLAQDRKLTGLIDELIRRARHQLFESPDESRLLPVEAARQELEEYIADIRSCSSPLPRKATDA
jgi:hypothetical protein